MTCWSSTSAAPAAPTRSAARPWNASAAARSRSCSNSARSRSARPGRASPARKASATSRLCGSPGGYEKLVLYGTSYGTKVALEYAQQYPQNVEALVLDSVVPVDGPEPFAIPSFRRAPGCMRELCCQATPAPGSPAIRSPTSPRSTPACAAARSAARCTTERPPPPGHARRDRAAAARSRPATSTRPCGRCCRRRCARRCSGDPDPLLRLHVLSEGLIPTPAQRTAGRKHRRTSTKPCSPPPPARRARSRGRAAHRRPPGWPKPTPSWRPSPAATSTPSTRPRPTPRACWKPARPGPTPRLRPRPKGRCPDVPTLILSGAQDLRTPTSNARQVAAEIPDAEVEVVPFTGHSVLGSDLSECAADAVSSFFSGQARRPAPRPPTRSRRPRWTPPASAGCGPRAGLSGRPGRTLDGGARRDRRPQPPGRGGHAAGRRRAAERLELRWAARRLRDARRATRWCCTASPSCPAWTSPGASRSAGAGVAPPCCGSAARRRPAGSVRLSDNLKRRQRHARRAQLPAVGGQR